MAELGMGEWCPRVWKQHERIEVHDGQIGGHQSSKLREEGGKILNRERKV